MSPDWPLETERLTLRPFHDGDLDAVFAMRSNPEVAVERASGVVVADIALNWQSELIYAILEHEWR